MKNNFFQFSENQNESLDDLIINYNQSLKRNYTVPTYLPQSARKSEISLMLNNIFLQSLREAIAIFSRLLVDSNLKSGNLNDRSRDAIESSIENLSRAVTFGFFNDQYKGPNFLFWGGLLSVVKMVDSAIANSGRNSPSMIFENSRIGKIINNRFNSNRGRLLKKFFKQMTFITSLHAICSFTRPDLNFGDIQDVKNYKDKYISQPLDILVGFIISIFSASLLTFSPSSTNRSNNNSLTNDRGINNDNQENSQNSPSNSENQISNESQHALTNDVLIRYEDIALSLSDFINFIASSYSLILTSSLINRSNNISLANAENDNDDNQSISQNFRDESSRPGDDALIEDIALNSESQNHEQLSSSSLEYSEHEVGDDIDNRNHILISISSPIVNEPDYINQTFLANAYHSDESQKSDPTDSLNKKYRSAIDLIESVQSAHKNNTTNRNDYLNSEIVSPSPNPQNSSGPDSRNREQSRLLTREEVRSTATYSITSPRLIANLGNNLDDRLPNMSS